MIEKPPQEKTQRRLWAMEFNPKQRMAIIEVASDIGIDPVTLGIFCMSNSATKNLEKLGIVIAPNPWYLELWLSVRFAWQWITSWRFDLYRLVKRK